MFFFETQCSTYGKLTQGTMCQILSESIEFYRRYDKSCLECIFVVHNFTVNITARLSLGIWRHVLAYTQDYNVDDAV